MKRRQLLVPRYNWIYFWGKRACSRGRRGRGCFGRSRQSCTFCSTCSWRVPGRSAGDSGGRSGWCGGFTLSTPGRTTRICHGPKMSAIYELSPPRTLCSTCINRNFWWVRFFFESFLWERPALPFSLHKVKGTDFEQLIELVHRLDQFAPVHVRDVLGVLVQVIFRADEAHLMIDLWWLETDNRFLWSVVGI